VTFPEIVAAVSAALSVAVATDRLIQRLMEGKYVKREELDALSKTFKTEQHLQSGEISRAHHRVDLVLESMKGLPGYGHINDLKKEVSEVKEGLAVNNTKLEGIGENISRMGGQLDRIVDKIHGRAGDD
jgi:hypothetical protein